MGVAGAFATGSPAAESEYSHFGMGPQIVNLSLQPRRQHLVIGVHAGHQICATLTQPYIERARNTLILIESNENDSWISGDAINFCDGFDCS